MEGFTRKLWRFQGCAYSVFALEQKRIWEKIFETLSEDADNESGANK